MKKSLLITVIVIFFASLSLAKSGLPGPVKKEYFAGTNYDQFFWSGCPYSFDNKCTPADKPTLPSLTGTMLDVAREHAKTLENEASIVQDMKESITGPRPKVVDIPSLNERIFLSLNLGKIKSAQGNLEDFLKIPGYAALQKEEEAFVSAPIDEVRESVAKRVLRAAISDKAISLQAFKNAEERLKQLSKVVNVIKSARNLRHLLELQTYLNTKLALLQNEVTKLQMVAHVSDAERNLLNQHKRELGVKRLGIKKSSAEDKNAGAEMPRIRSQMPITVPVS